VSERIAACDACLRRGYLIGLLAGRIAGLIDRPGRRAHSLLALSDAELAMAVGGDGADEALQFLAHFEPARARADLHRADVGATCPHGGAYPGGLRDLQDPPAALFHVGRVELLEAVTEEPAVTIVGARDASPYGLEVAHDLSRGLAAAGITTISGMALGIDGAAHRGALGGRGDTIAVLACGPDVPYPRRHRELHRQISREGLVLSELPPGQRPYRWSFPARNRLMAALARMTVVVEAGEASGTLITTDFAQDMGRTLGAVPGRVTARLSAGSNKLLRDGAPVIRDAGDVLDELFGVGARARRPADLPANLDPLQRRLLDAVEASLDMDGICAFAGVPAGEARAALARLEARGLVRRDGLLGWQRRRPRG
jgi:DNA processing protein